MRVEPAVSALALATALLATSSLAADDPPPLLTDATYKSVRDQVNPSDAELAFRKLGWRSSLWQAVVEAHEKDRPVLLWAMNGHPLGCT